MSSEDQKKLQSLSDTYSKLQSDISANATTLQRLQSQSHETTSVLTEFHSLPIESSIYKAIGPCLLKQDRTEAVQAVEARLEFIEGERKKVEGVIEGLQKQSEGVKMEVFELQTRMQQQGQAS